MGLIRPPRQSGFIFMGNCLSLKEPCVRLKKKQVEFRKAFAPSSCTKPKKVASEISNVVNVPETSNVPVTSNVVNVAMTSDVVSLPVTGNEVTAAEAPKDVEDFQQITSYGNVHIFSYNELSLATNHFRPDLILGEGGFGLVYKGVIDENVRPGFKSTEVAVKELNPDGFQGDREWLAEVNYLGQFSHPNLVKLIGYCCEDEHRLLVYEYMACGSLEMHLFQRNHTLTWSIRMKIALDAAKGLAFLHGAERSIIYRDFKTSNILLDAEFNAKLSDFGLAKEGPTGDQTHVSTRVMGTYGYAAPEYIMTGHLTARSDVYGFGVVLLEMLVGQRALDKSRPREEHNLVEWARPLLIRTTKLLRIIDPRMQGQHSSKIAVKVANLAHRCLSENPKMRPMMSEVVEALEAYNQEEMLIQSCRAAVALQEASKEALASHAAAERRKQQPSKMEGGERETMVHERKIKPGNGRSRIDTPKELDHPDGPQKDSKSVPNGERRFKPSADEDGQSSATTLVGLNPGRICQWIL